jgi:hypothetical protein
MHTLTSIHHSNQGGFQEWEASGREVLTPGDSSDAQAAPAPQAATNEPRN